jgi:YaiO family outer membrane protein
MTRLILTVFLAVTPLAALAVQQDPAIRREADAQDAISEGRLDDALASYRELSRMYPERDDFQVWTGRLSRWLGDAGTAIAYLEPVLARHPDHAEARVEMAYVLMATQRFEEARGLLEPMAAKDDGNVDLLMAMARLHRYQGENPEAAAYVDEILTTYPDHPEALELRRAISAALEGEPRYSITFGYGHDRFTFAEPGHSVNLTASYLGDRSRLDLQVERWDKFGTRTQRLGPSVSHRFGERLWVRGAAMWAGNAGVLPGQTVTGGVSWAFPGGWVLAGDYRQLRFEDPLVHVASPSLEYYFEHPGWIRAAFYQSWTRYRKTPTPNTSDIAFAVQYSRQIGSRFTGSVAYAHGNESYSDLSIDKVGSLGANTYTFGGTMNWTRRLSTRVYYSHRQASNDNDQDSLTLSLTILR